MLHPLYLRTKRTGAVIVLFAPGGGAGTGDARSTMASAARSSVSNPDVRAKDADTTRPAASMLKLTYAVPVSPRARAAEGYFFRRSRWAASLAFQVETDAVDRAAPSLGRLAAVRLPFFTSAAALLEAGDAGFRSCLACFRFLRVTSGVLIAFGTVVGRCAIGRGMGSGIVALSSASISWFTCDAAGSAEGTDCVRISSGAGKRSGSVCREGEAGGDNGTCSAASCRSSEI